MELLYNQNFKCYVWRGLGPDDQLIAEKQGFKLHKLGAFTTKDPMKAYSLIDYAKGDACRKLMAIEDNIEMSWAESSSLVVPVPKGLAYKPFQLAGIEHHQQHKVSMNADQPGLGKTIQFLGLSNLIGAKSHLIICPAHLRENWLRESRKWLLTDLDWTVVTSRGQSLSQNVVISYELLKPYYDELISMEFDLGGVDEAHYIKSETAIRTQLILGIEVKPLFKRCGRFIFMTGTPVANRSNDFWPILSFAAPQILENRNYWNYVRNYCETYESGYGVSVVGSKNEEQLYNRLRSGFMIRRLKKDVLKQLPDKQYQLIVFTPSGKLHGIYKQTTDFTEQQVIELGMPADYAINPTVRREEGLEKVDMVVSYVREIMDFGVEKPLILAYHIDTIEALAEQLADLNPAVIYGKTLRKDIEVDHFQYEKSCRCFILNVASATGITLTAATDAIFAEYPFNPSELEQGIDRIHRIGQTGKVTVRYTVVQNTLDAEILSRAFSKAADNHKMIDRR